MRPELDRLRCDAPDCDCDDDEIVLGSVCHPGAPVWAVYANGGELTLRCSECDEVVLTIAVAG